MATSTLSNQHRPHHQLELPSIATSTTTAGTPEHMTEYKPARISLRRRNDVSDSQRSRRSSSSSSSTDCNGDCARFTLKTTRKSASSKTQITPSQDQVDVKYLQGDQPLCSQPQTTCPSPSCYITLETSTIISDSSNVLVANPDDICSSMKVQRRKRPLNYQYSKTCRKTRRLVKKKKKEGHSRVVDDSGNETDSRCSDCVSPQIKLCHGKLANTTLWGTSSTPVLMSSE